MDFKLKDISIKTSKDLITLIIYEQIKRKDHTINKILFKFCSNLVLYIMSVSFATKISIQKYSQSFQLDIYNIRGAKKG